MQRRLGWWAVLTISLVAATAVGTDLARLTNPIGEKYVPSFGPGQNDFSYAYWGARALLAKVNPYRNNRPELTNPIFGIERIEGVEYKQLYPPGYLLTLTPLAKWKGAEWQDAARVWFRFNLALLLGLAALTWDIARRTVQARLTPLWIPLFFMCLALNPGEELGLERGQGDTLMAFLCWAAVAAFARGSVGIAMFLAIWATAIKGYAVLFAAGLGLLALRPRKWLRASAGSVAAIALFTLPARAYLRDAATALRYRSEMFQPKWYNHGFRNLAYRFSPTGAETGRRALTAFALAVTVAAAVGAWRSSARGTTQAQASSLVLFALASLGTIIGYSAFSVSYDLIMLFPGLLVLALSQRRLCRSLALPVWVEQLVGAALLASLGLLFLVRLGDDPPGYEGNIPGAAYGLAGLFVTLAGLSMRGAVRRTAA